MSIFLSFHSTSSKCLFCCIWKWIRCFDNVWAGCFSSYEK